MTDDDSKVGESSQQLTDLIRRASRNDVEGKSLLYSEIYDELRKVAHRFIRHERDNEFQTTALVNEVVLRFEKYDSLRSMANRKVFFSVASRAMNQILIDHYRRRKKLVDGPDRSAKSFDLILNHMEETLGIEFESLQVELQALERDYPRQHSVVMHKFFGGLTIGQTAELLGVSAQTVERDWRIARARLFRRLRES